MSIPKTTRPTRVASAPNGTTSAGSALPAPAMESTATNVEPQEREQTSPQVMRHPTPMVPPPAGTKTGRDHLSRDTHEAIVSAPIVPGDHNMHDAQNGPVAGELDQPTAIEMATSTSAPPSADNFPRTAIRDPAAKHGPPSGGAEQGPRATKAVSLPTRRASLADPMLALAADVLDDLEKVKIANENRLRQLTRNEPDKDGEERGFGLDESHPDVARLAALVDMLAQAEHQAVLNLQRVMRKHPLGPWMKAQKGIGEKQGARLLAAIGDPYIRPEIAREDGTVEPSRPRIVSELWAYTGNHVINSPVSGHGTSENQPEAATDGSDFPADQRFIDARGGPVGGEQAGDPGQTVPGTQARLAGVAPKRARGERANWSSTAKMRAYLIAESCLKNRESPFRVVYDDARTKYADAVHKVPCVRCGPKGKPAQTGSPLSDGHKHARAMRAMSKAVLKELWRESKRLHEEVPDA